jgi:hypothetical protein
MSSSSMSGFYRQDAQFAPQHDHSCVPRAVRRSAVSARDAAQAPALEEPRSWTLRREIRRGRWHRSRRHCALRRSVRRSLSARLSRSRIRGRVPARRVDLRRHPAGESIAGPTPRKGRFFFPICGMTSAVPSGSTYAIREAACRLPQSGRELVNARRREHARRPQIALGED